MASGARGPASAWATRAVDSGAERGGARPRCGRRGGWGSRDGGDPPAYGFVMSDYDIVTTPVFAALEKISIASVKKMSDHHWFNRTLCQVNDSLVRIGVFHGEFHWHAHEREDEFFLVLEGNLEIEIEGKPTAVLAVGEGIMVPKGVRHRPIAKTGATVLMVEQATIVPTGS